MDNGIANCTLLAGGVGAAKFVQGLAQIHDRRRVRIVSNTGDDIERHGLWISPDVDIMLYTLAGIVDPAQGWGVAGDTFEMLAALERLGEETWFRLGDRDCATHIFRANLRRKNISPTEITRRLAELLHVRPAVMPMTDDAVETRVRTPQGWMHFQEFLVKHRCAPEILDVTFAGAENARPGPDVHAAIADADIIFICPSNPVASIGPMLAMPGMRAALAAAPAARVAISPLVGGRSLKGPSDRMMRAMGFRADAMGVAQYYRGLIDGIVIDSADADLRAEIEAEGIAALITDTMMPTADRKAALARQSLTFAQDINDQHRHSRQTPVLR